MTNAVANFNSNNKTVTDYLGNGFIYNQGSNSNVNSTSINDFIYNDDHGKRVTINAGEGDDTINDHSALSMVKYVPEQGNDSINFHDTDEYYY